MERICNVQRLWAIDLNIGVHDTAVSYEMFRFLTNGHFNANLGTYYADVQGRGSGAIGAGGGGPQSGWADGEEGGEGDGGVRCYAVSDMTYHPNLATVQYNVFFNLCRLKGVHFDLQDKLGTGPCRALCPPYALRALVPLLLLLHCCPCYCYY